MKWLINILLGAFLLVGFAGCKKEIEGCTHPFAFNYDVDATLDDGSCTLKLIPPRDTTYISLLIPNPQSKIVLLEEFTGVYCYTCPLGHLVVDSLLNENPGRIAALNIHSTFYGIYDNPLVMGNKFDFRTVDGDTMVAMLGGIISVPSGAVDRMIHSGENTILSKNRYQWRNYLKTQLVETPPVNVEIDTEYDSADRGIQIAITLNYTKDVAENNYLTVVVAENDVVDKQLKPDFTVNNNYQHPHIFRDCLTDAKGDKVETKLERGRAYMRVYDYTLPVEWNEKNVEIVAFVHEKDNSWKVLQAATKNINN